MELDGIILDFEFNKLENYHKSFFAQTYFNKSNIFAICLIMFLLQLNLVQTLHNTGYSSCATIV